jgi:hypothetical protein
MTSYLEQDYVRSLLGHAAMEFSDVRLFVRQVGAIKTDGRVFRAGIKGQADLYAVDRRAKHYEIEVKRFTKLSPDQEAWKAWCSAWGVPWLLLEVRKAEMPVDTIDRWVEELRGFFAQT